ncbi:MAG TPA: hypothetical protein VJX23_12050 [Candidatus Binataceae bacterium]|jgi:hypothetical protein|nr:hypothetical protein [Candidatus Binataceae bacterium]
MAQHKGSAKHDGTATFRLPRGWQVAVLVVVMLGPCSKLLIDFRFGMILSPVPQLIEIPVWMLVWIFLVPRYTVQVRPDGVKLYSLWWLPWSDVREVRYWKLLGLPYFRVKRGRGFSWWIPLYFVGDCDLGNSIMRAAPPGNPFRSVLIPP